MDILLKRDSDLPQDGIQEHPKYPATSVVQPDHKDNSFGAALNICRTAVGYFTPANQPVPNRNFNQPSSSGNGLGQCDANTMGVGQTMPSHSSGSQLPQTYQELGFGGSREHPGKTISVARQPQLLTPKSRSTRLNHSSDSQSLQPPTQSWRKWIRKPGVESRVALLPTPSTNPNASVSSGQNGGNHAVLDDSQRGVNCGVSQYAVKKPIMDGSLFGRDLPVRDSSKNVANRPIPRGGEYRCNCPLPNISTVGNDPQSPDNHSQSSQPPTLSWRKWIRKPGVESRVALLPTTTRNPNDSVNSSQYGGNRAMLDDSQLGINCDVSQYPVNNPIMDGSLFGRNFPVHDGSEYVTNHPIPRGSEYRSDRPMPNISTAGNRPVPDGTTYNLKYPAPDVKNLMFDSSTGYRFDPTTGLHYDANSGFYLNNRMKVLLRWDPVSSTYVLVSNNASGLAKPVMTLMNATRDSTGVLPGVGQSQEKSILEDMEQLAREVAREVLTSRQKRLNPNRYETLLRGSDCHRKSQDLDSYHSLGRNATCQRRVRSPDFYPNHIKRTRRNSSERESPIGDLRNRVRREPEPCGYHPNSPLEPTFPRQDDYDIVGRLDVRDGMWNDRSYCSFGRSRSAQRRSRSPSRRRRSYSSVGDSDASITEIHDRNLRNAHNLYGRYFSMSPSSTPCILIAPVQPKTILKRSVVAEILKDMISSDGLDFRSVRVFQGGFGAPCNYALVQFYSEDAALFWYKLHRGTINLGSQYTTFLFLSEDHWVCQKQENDDRGCDTPTPNFPFRTICYMCLELRSKLESPIIKVGAPTQWIGICLSDCIKFSSFNDVMSILPPCKGISIESAEFLRETSGIPIGLCVFQILDKEQANYFLTILKKEKFDVSYVLLDKKALDSPPLSLGSRAKTLLGNQLKLVDKDPVEQTSSVEIESDNERLGSKAIKQGLTPTEKYMEELSDDSPRQSHLPKTSPETIFGDLHEEFAVNDEATENKPKPFSGGRFNKVKPFLGGPTNKNKPLLRGPMNQIIKEQLKSIDLFHLKNAEDPDNILRNTFVGTPALRPSVLLSPIPRDKELAMNELEKILISDGAKSHCQSIGIFRGKGFGAPGDYALVHFYKPVKALRWYNQNKALLCLDDGSNDQVKVFMFFSQDNWKCLHCTFMNFPLRNWCNRCFKNKNQNVFSRISESRVPTQLLGITMSGLPDSMHVSNFNTVSILAALHEEESRRVISSKMMLQDKGLPGLCVLETQDSKECEILCKRLQSNGWRASFIQVHPDPDEACDSGNESESDAAKASEQDKTSVIAQPQHKIPPLVKHSNRKYDLLKLTFENSPKSPFIILSPVPRVKWLTVKQHLDEILRKDGLNSSCFIDVCRPEVYGSSQDYIQVCFTDLGKAVSWHDKHKGVLELLFPETRGRKEITSQLQMYYAGCAWSCRACSAKNFPARSLCHECYAHRDEDGFTPVTISSTPTKWVGISRLRPSISNVDQVKKVLPPLGGFYIMRMEFIREPNPLLYLGLCVIEAPTEKRAAVLAEYLEKHPALEYNNEKNANVIFVNLNRRSGEDSCEQDSMVNSDQNGSSDDLAFLCSSVAQDGTFAPNDSASNFHLWWENLRNSLAEGEDFLKNLFEHQVVVPLPAGNSVFVPLPANQQAKGSQAEQTGQPVGFSRKVYGPLFVQGGVSKEIAEQAKLYIGKCVGSPCSYTILTFETASEAFAWRARHSGKWVIDLGSTQWTSFLHSCDPNWTCEKCNSPNFPLRLYCFCCFETRLGGAPLVTISHTPTRFVGITKFQNWCASEEILFESIKVLPRMKEKQQLKQVHYITEPSGISLGLCVLELENAAIARTIFTHLMSLTRRMQNIIYVEINSL